MMYTHIKVIEKEHGLQMLVPLGGKGHLMLCEGVAADNQPDTAIASLAGAGVAIDTYSGFSTICRAMIDAGLVLDCTGFLSADKPVMTGFDLGAGLYDPISAEEAAELIRNAAQAAKEEIATIKAHLLPLAEFDERFARESVADVVGELVNLWQQQREIIKQSQLDFKDQRRIIDGMNKGALERGAELARLDSDIKTALAERVKVEGELRDCRAELDDLRHENETLMMRLKSAEERAADAERRLSVINGTAGQSASQAPGRGGMASITRAAPLTIQQARGMLAQHTQPCACETCDAARGTISRGNS